MITKMPPIEKIYEAYSVLADERFDLHPQSAIVTSSDGSKAYKVRWDGDTYASSDSATYWQGYPGYPIIAVLLLQGRLPYDALVASWFKGIPWKRLNNEHKRDYAAALLEAFEYAGLTDQQIERAQEQAQIDYDALKSLNISIKRTR